MLYIDSIWEYIVNFLELALFIIFIHKNCVFEQIINIKQF